MPQNPLILTLLLNQTAEEYFTRLRDRYFPPERNFLKAHVTLFHQLPQEPAILNQVEFAAANQAELALSVTGLISFGNGVAYKLESNGLQQMHCQLQEHWKAFLISQDQQKLRPHITVQNKVKPEIARALKQELEQNFSAFQVTGTGLALWEYLGGPWKLFRSFPFQK